MEEKQEGIWGRAGGVTLLLPSTIFISQKRHPEGSSEYGLEILVLIAEIWLKLGGGVNEVSEESKKSKTPGNTWVCVSVHF